MCGIGGMLGQPDRAVLQRMNSLQQHRGPDATDVWMNEHAGFAHARLAIVDIDSSEQPMHSGQGVVLIANCEIYNYRLLRKQSPNYPFATMGDSEAILALHAKATANVHRPLSAQDHAAWISELDGMYAFALWDDNHNQLLLARDPMGIKPLSRTQIENSLLFASEVKAFHADERYHPRLDELALAARLIWEYPLDATTLLADVHQIRPGTVEVWSVDQHGAAFLLDVAHVERQHLSPTETWDATLDAPALLESFITSVEQRLMAEVPVGIVLSGGLDSSLVCAVAHEAAQRADQPVPECWTVAENEENPDWKAAELVASHLGLTHHQHVLEEDAFQKHLPKLVWHGEDLDVTVMFFQPLFEHMSSHVKVGLCGQGADEMHGGYPRYGDLHAYREQLSQRQRDIPPIHKQALSEGNLDASQGWYSPKHDPVDRCRDLKSLLEFELEHGQLSNFQLRLVDRHSMAHSLEVRVPFLGRAHRQLSHRLPMDWKRSTLMEEKAALRRAADLTALPKEIVRRPKLPAGKATAPTMLHSFLEQYSAPIETLLERYSAWRPALEHQRELALGLGLFESLHLHSDGHAKSHRTLDALLDEVI